MGSLCNHIGDYHVVYRMELWIEVVFGETSGGLPPGLPTLFLSSTWSKANMCFKRIYWKIQMKMKGTKMDAYGLFFPIKLCGALVFRSIPAASSLLRLRLRVLTQLLVTHHLCHTIFVNHLGQTIFHTAPSHTSSLSHHLCQPSWSDHLSHSS